MKAKRIIFTILALLWMGLIFLMSAQTGTESGGLSDGICRAIGSIFVKGFEEWSAVRQAEFVASISFYIRKLAHMTEYAILGILWAEALHAWGIQMGRTALFSIIIAVLYAFSDEAHQLLVAGRSGQVRDVAIDAAGAAVGVAVAVLIAKARERRRKQHLPGEVPDN